MPVYAEAKLSEAAPAYSETPEMPTDSRTLSTSSDPPQRSGSNFTADGKSSEQIIREAKEKAEAKKREGGGWKNTMKRAGEYTMMGAGS